MPKLHDPATLVTSALIGGRSVDRVGDGRQVEVSDPATGELVARVPRCGEAEVRAAIDAATRAAPAMRAMPAAARSALLARIAAGLRARREDLAAILTAEQGKPLAESRAELDYGLSYLDYYASLALHLDGEVLVSPSAAERIVVYREPVGLGVAITPWNFPFAMIARKLAPAFAGGNVLIVKPAAQTPLSALAFAKAALDAGLPEGALSVVTGHVDDAADLGRWLLEDGRVRKLSFTGSTAVGKALYAACAPTMKHLSLELGGNAPFLVFDDADVDAAVEGLMIAKFRNGGQACVAANRVLVQAGIHDAFVQRLEARVRALRVGKGSEDGVDVGPLIDARAVAKVKAHVDDARAREADVVVGGEALGGNFYAPTLVVGLPVDARISQEETFGPVAAITRFETEAEGVGLANATPFGLAAYLYARDVGRVHRMSDAIESGMVAVNVGLLSNAIAPFGGVKESGLGREGGRQGLDAWVVPKYVRYGGLDR